MKIVNGSVTLEKPQKKKQQTIMPRAIWAPECHLCMQPIHNVEQSRIGCLNNLCKLTCHIICLANHILAADPSQRGHYIPISGECPLCETPLLWIELLQRKRKMQGILCEENEDDDDEEDDGDSDDDVDDDLNNIDCNVSLTQNYENAEDVAEALDIYELSD